MTTTTKIEVINYKAVRGDEGDCFDAVVTINGHRLAVMSDGNGGGFSYHAAKPYGRPAKQSELDAYEAAMKALEAAARAQVAVENVELEAKGEKPHNPDWWSLTADCIVDDAFAAFAEAKRLRRLLKSHVLFVSAQGIRQMKVPKGDTVEGAAGYVRKRHGEATVILNALPEAEAFSLFSQHVQGG